MESAVYSPPSNIAVFAIIAMETRDGSICYPVVQNNYLREWKFPGGKVENGETPEEAIRREIWEELRVTLPVPVGYFEKPFFETKGGVRHRGKWTQGVFWDDPDTHEIIFYFFRIQAQKIRGKEGRRKARVMTREVLSQKRNWFISHHWRAWREARSLF